ncbi:MAG: bifunctional folylpolyglutamate synthase/dihydrofolate synthase, partial [Clostridia bacterium]|nr:bifunctional folylpolyglutamate synthase/dihydrofolate synthase [Clostridia bacterium]
MNYAEALNYINRGFFGGTRPGLERVSELLGYLGDPQNNLRFIHVAGTNGKGSFCAMMDSVLREAGYHTGLYTSPYIERFNERIVIDGQPISDQELADITDYVRPFADKMEDKPTEFELITAIAM